MIVKIEKSGCCERKGLVQIRFCMYLEPGDFGYERHRVQVLESGAVYTGKRDTLGMPLDIADYISWRDTQVKVWQTNPFHNHFIYAKHDIDPETIIDIGEAFLQEAYIKWACEEKLNLLNPRLPATIKRSKVKSKGMVARLKTLNLERTVNGY